METQTTKEPSGKMKATVLQKITPFLWFNTQAEEAVNFYTSIFKNSGIKLITHYGAEAEESTGIKKGSVMTVSFQIEGQEFTALNGGPYFQFSPSVSFFVNCESLEEIKSLWASLSLGGTVLMELDKYPFSEQFGWLNDKFGLSWQLILAKKIQKIIPAVMFSGNQAGKAEEAINFYISLFRNSGMLEMDRYGKDAGEPEGSVMFARFALHGCEFIAMDNRQNHPFSITPAVSFVINCENQEEVDHFWEQLTEGGDEKAQQCGWLQDRYGLSWQVVPTVLVELLSDPDPVKSGKVMEAMLKMKKIEILGLMNAIQQE
jgi:predicted 3-demethylubiquinone-9 3-methyltransferase (glyoxalase superfamily)